MSKGNEHIDECLREGIWQDLKSWRQARVIVEERLVHSIDFLLFVSNGLHSFSTTQRKYIRNQRKSPELNLKLNRFPLSDTVWTDNKRKKCLYSWYFGPR